MTEDIKMSYLKTIFQFKNLINTEFGRGKQHVLSLTDLLILQGIQAGKSSVEIATDLRITKAAVSQCTTALAKKELITRTPDPENRRNLTLALTDDGVAQLKMTNDEFDQAFDGFVDDMGEGELRQMLMLMAKMTKIIGE